MTLSATQAIDRFLRGYAPEQSRDLVQRFLDAGGAARIETQVTVLPDTGFDAKPLRIPRHANSIPEWNDYPLSWPTDPCVEAIGATGWDWQAKRSRWFAYDFDSIAGHKQGLTEAELWRIKSLNHPWLEVRRSTGGAGIHLYVSCEPIDCENHTTHAHLARVVLEVLSKELGLSLAESLDVGGHVLWIWSRRATVENRGLELLTPQTELFPVSALPADWREQAPIANAKHRVQGADLPRNVTELDDEHKQHIEQLHAQGFTTVWVEELGLLQTHTSGFAKLIESNDIKGFFATNSTGSDPGQPNCFAFPQENGAWRVFRFGAGTKEHDSWQHSTNGWTQTVFNQPCSITEAAQQLGLCEGADGYQGTLGQVASLAKMIGDTFDLDGLDSGRDVDLTLKNKSRLVIKLPMQEGDPDKLPGWVSKPSARPPRFEAVIGKVETSDIAETKYARFVLSETGKSLGLASWIRGQWVDERQTEATLTLLAHGIKPECTQLYLSRAKQSCYTLVNRPFESEYPEPRVWNRDAARFAYEMADEDGPHPHFDLVLKHFGKNLTPAVQANEWCQGWGVETGEQYLLTWAASMIQRPFQCLPYLFAFGPQNCGKSSFHRALGFLMQSGARQIDKMFLRGNTFDAELRGTILGVIEEANLTGSHAKGAYDKIKKLTDSPTISVEPKGWDSFEQRNSLHMIQTANFANCCPILEADDSRIVVIRVDPLTAEIPEPLLIEKWREEAPYFIRTLRTLDLPPVSASVGRLFLPILSTDAKAEVIEAVAAISKHSDAEQSAAVLAQRLEPALKVLVAAQGIQDATYDQLCQALRLIGADDAIPRDARGQDNTRVLGAALSKLESLQVERSTHHGNERRITITQRAA